MEEMKQQLVMDKDIKPEKFVFETDFFEVAVKEQEARENQVVITEEDLAQAESKGYAEGLEKGRAQSAEQFQSELTNFLTPLKERLEMFSNEKSELHRLVQEKAVVVIAQTVKLLFKHLEKELNEESLASAISQTLEDIVKDVKIIVRVNPQAYDFLSGHNALQALLSNKNAELKADATLSAGECHMEWEDAGARIDLLTVTKSLEASLSGLLPKVLKEDVAPADQPQETVEDQQELTPAEQEEPVEQLAADVETLQAEELQEAEEEVTK